MIFGKYFTRWKCVKHNIFSPSIWQFSISSPKFGRRRKKLYCRLTLTSLSLVYSVNFTRLNITKTPKWHWISFYFVWMKLHLPRFQKNMPLTLWSFAAPSKHPADEGVGWQEGVQVHHHHLQPHQIHHHHLSPFKLHHDLIFIWQICRIPKEILSFNNVLSRRPLYNDTSYVRALGDVQKWAYYYYYCYCYCYDGMFQCASWFSSNIFQL